MLPTTLITALLFSAPAPSAQDSLIARVADDCPIVVYVGDMAAMLTAREESALTTLMNDDRVMDGFATIFDVLGEEMTEQDSEDASAMLDAFGTVCSELHGAAIGFTFPDESGRIALRGTDDLMPKLLQFLALAIGEEMTESELEGQTFRSVDDELHRWVMIQSGDEILISVEAIDEMTLEDQAQDVADRLSREDAATDTHWWDDISERPSNPLFEFFVGGTVFEDDEDPEIQMISEFIDGAYIGMEEDGPGEWSTVMAVAYPGNQLMTDLSGVLENGDPELLKIAPSDATGTVVARVDIQGMVESIASFADMLEGGIYEQYEAGLQAAESILGFSIEEGIFDNMTGDYFTVQWSQDPEAIFADEEDAAAAFQAMGVFGAFFGDSEPFLTLLELGEQAAGSDMVTTSSGDDYEGWRFEFMEGVELFAAVTDSAIVLGVEDSVLSVLERLDATEADGYVTAPMLATAKTLTEGIGWSIFDTQGILDAFVAGVGMAVESDPDAPEEMLDAMIGVLEAMGDVVGDTVYVDTNVTQDRFVVRWMTR